MKCIQALEQLEHQDSLPVFESALSDESPTVRLTAVRAAYRIAGPKSKNLLKQALKDKDEIVRHRAASCLRWLEKAPAEQ